MNTEPMVTDIFALIAIMFCLGVVAVVDITKFFINKVKGL